MPVLVAEGDVGVALDDAGLFREVHQLHGLPTVVNNVETLCNVPLVARAGALLGTLAERIQSEGGLAAVLNGRGE